jgi:hypothetical protein
MAEIDINQVIGIVNKETEIWIQIKETAMEHGPLSSESLVHSVALAEQVHKMSNLCQGDLVLLELAERLAMAIRNEDYREAENLKREINEHVTIPDPIEVERCEIALKRLGDFLKKQQTK